jgi:hypothetical protein
LSCENIIENADRNMQHSSQRLQFAVLRPTANLCQ